MTPGEKSDATVTKSFPDSRMRGLAALFLKLGAISFGGPAAAISLMEEEVVAKRQWLSRQQFLDMLGLTNLIPGPNSTEMAIAIGYLRAGWAGLAVAGASFILPAALLTAAVAWAYVRFVSLPLTTSLLSGVKPAVIAVILVALWRLGKAAVRSTWLAALAALATAMCLLRVNALLILLGGGLIGILVKAAHDLRTNPPDGRHLWANLVVFKKWSLLPIIRSAILPNALLMPALAPKIEAVPLTRLGWFFLKVGAVLYGGGYILFAFVEQGLVREHHWLTQQQLLDAIAIGQFTPGPVLSTATFIGYLLAGGRGAAVATVAIFLPSFLYVAALGPILPRLRKSLWMAAFLDSVNVCAVAVMAGVTVSLAGDALRGWPTWLIAALALAALWKWKINPAWVVLGGALTGLLLKSAP